MIRSPPRSTKRPPAKADQAEEGEAAVDQAEAGGEVAASPTTGSRMLSCVPAFSSCLPSPPACVPRCVPAVAAKLSTALIYDLFAVLKKDSTTPQTFYEAPPSARAARCNLDLGQISARSWLDRGHISARSRLHLG